MRDLAIRLCFFFNLVLVGVPLSVASDDPITIIITSGRMETPLEDLPAAVSALGEDAIDAGRQQLNLDEALSTVPGVFTLSPDNFAQDLRLSMRGFGARANFGIRGVRIFIDGIPATTPDGQSAIDDIDLGALKGVEVIRGPAGALYGSSAGGVLGLESHRGGALAHVEGGFRSGAYGFSDRRLKSRGHQSGVDYAVSFSKQRIEGYREQAEMQRDLFNGRFDYAFLNGGELTVTLAVLDAPIAEDPGGLTLEQVNEDPRQAGSLNLRFNTGEQVRQQRLGLRSWHPLNSTTELRWRAYLVNRDFSNRLPFAITELDRRFGGGGLELLRDSSWFGGPGRLLMGVDMDYQDDTRRRLGNIDGQAGEITFNQDERVINRGVFIMREQKLNRYLRLDVGLRYDAIRIRANDRFLSDGNNSDEVNFNHWSPSAALMFQRRSATRIYARIASSFETPTTTELARPDGSGGFNKQLDAETSLSYELGMRSYIRRLNGNGVFITFEAAIFENQIKDQLVAFEIPSSPGRFAFENAGRSRFRGLETSTSAQLFQSWTVKLAYTHSDFKFRRFRDRDGVDLSNKRLPGVPQDVLNVELRYRPVEDLELALDTRYYDRFFTDNSNTATSPSATVSRLRVDYGHSHRQWQIDFFGGINNLFNERYHSNIRLNANAERFYEPAPKRHAYLGMNLKYSF